ncbi:MAG: NAD-dependent epimerase/dehydratase family protein, partial [Candidatus Omnitrophica bacterium]|nr:NAD-dependent epimerase/dehydratase family protein [Candidatus Omnitrophota bacterium]
MKTMLVTGSAGLIGSEVCFYFHEQGWCLHGIDNNMRSVFFGPAGDTRWNQKRLKKEIHHYTHHNLDIRNRSRILSLIKKLRPQALVHAASQPSHDKAVQIPFDDFEINALGTLNLLEACRRFSPETIFVFLSTNKVYGDGPNRIPLKELPSRWDYADKNYENG